MNTSTIERPESIFDESDYSELLDRRQRRARIGHAVLLAVLVVAVGALATLLYTVINDAFGLTAVVNEVEPEVVLEQGGYDPSGAELSDLNETQLVELLAGGITTNVGRRLEREQRFFADRLVFEPTASWDALCASEDATSGCTATARDRANILNLVEERLIQPTVVATYELMPSLFNREAIEAEIAASFPGARAQFRSWLSGRFIASPQSDNPQFAGVRTAIFGSLWVIVVTIGFSVPVGVGAAIYLEEFAPRNRVTSLIQTNINNLAGVPSIIYGMLGLAVLVRTLGPVMSGSFLGEASASENGRTILAAGLTLGLLILPIIIIASQEAIRAVPNSLRQAGLALGATRWQTVRSHVLPAAFPGIMTGTILAVARAIGETAPLIVVGASTFITTDPTSIFSKFTVLPIQIFQWTSRPQDEFRNLAAAAILVLLAMLLTLNAGAVILRNRYSKKA